jgi:hypothetical protein
LITFLSFSELTYSKFDLIQGLKSIVMRQLIRVVCFSAVMVSFASLSMAQDIADIINGSKHDANYLVKGYVSPLLNVVGTGFNQGWYNTAKTHKKFGVDLTVSISNVAIPSSDKFFTVQNKSLETLSLTTDHYGNSVTTVANPRNGSGKVPTIFGPNDTKSEYTYTDPTGSNFSQTIAGIGGAIDLKDLPMKRMPVPIYNLGFGLPKNIEVKIRFMPEVGPPEAKFNFFGIGVLHDIKQHIPGLKMVPFDLSAFVGFTKMTLNSEIDDNNPSQKGELAVSATTIQALVSKKISVLTFYGGTGYNFSKSTLAAKGSYDLDSDPETPDVKDPVDISSTSNGFRATVGMRLKLAVFTFHGDYSFQKYNTFTAGFGISVR